ncbi:MAG TPA: hypothetical protein IAB62_11470 [Candidatus Coprocola pullicola]|nr:hypothetical protein [Candidatus Coprocola pullicola]
MNFILNGKTLELDLFDVDEAEKMEHAIITSADEMIALGENPQQQSHFQTMRKGCHIIFEFFDSIWGEGTAKELFDGKTNYKVCLETYASCAKQYKKYMTEEAMQDMKELFADTQIQQPLITNQNCIQAPKQKTDRPQQIQTAKDKLYAILQENPQQAATLLNIYESGKGL